jgi:cell division protein DivIC
MRRVRKSGTGIGIISLVVLIICAIVLYGKIGLQDHKDKDIDKLARLETQKQELEDEAAEIENEKAYRQTKQYIEDVAKDKLGLVNKDDVIFKPEK